jgi:hypothetical protein
MPFTENNLGEPFTANVLGEPCPYTFLWLVYGKDPRLLEIAHGS